MGHHRAIYVKDIKIFTNCDISKIVVVDDTPITYCLNPDNAVPILPYFGENLDNHLLFLAKTLR
jgi:TFIIF-interacting CTD phosphatase-like protein